MARALLLLDRLLRSAERRGYQLSLEEGDLRIGVQGERFRLELREKLTQLRRTSERRTGNAYDYAPSGRFALCFEMEKGYRQRLCSEDKGSQTIEGRLDDILGSLQEAVETVRKRELESERKAEQDAERRLIEANQAKRRREETERREVLLKQAADWRSAGELRRFVEAVNVASQRLPSLEEQATIKGWIEWATRIADELDPLNSIIKSL